MRRVAGRCELLHMGANSDLPLCLRHSRSPYRLSFLQLAQDKSHDIAVYGTENTCHLRHHQTKARTLCWLRGPCVQRQGTLRSDRPRRKGEGMTSGKEYFSWGGDAVLPCESAPGLMCEVLDTEPACEQATLHVSDTRLLGRRGEGWWFVWPLVLTRENGEDKLEEC